LLISEKAYSSSARILFVPSMTVEINKVRETKKDRWRNEVMALVARRGTWKQQRRHLLLSRRMKYNLTFESFTVCLK
jgi:hypothetical protein